MASERQEFLNLREKPARLSVEEAAIYMGFSAHDIPILVSRGMLKPLANPPPSATKYFARVELEELATDVKWLSRATGTIHQHWRAKNGRKTSHRKSGESTGEFQMDGAA